MCPFCPSLCRARAWPHSFLLCLGMSNVVMFHLVISQKTLAEGDESGAETMAENSAFREQWCFPKGKGWILLFWDNPWPFHSRVLCSPSIWRIRTLPAQLCSQPKCQMSLCTLESDLLPLRSQKSPELFAFLCCLCLSVLKHFTKLQKEPSAPPPQEMYALHC